MRLAFEGLGLKPGDRVLEPGPGWGSFMRYATRRGVYVKGITLSRHQLEYVKTAIATEGWSADIEYQDFRWQRSSLRWQVSAWVSALPPCRGV